jgi:hypothetical protein
VYVERAEEVLDAFGVLRAAAKYATRDPGLASWFRKWADLEEQAISLYTFENRLVPGLLQTEAYARTLFNERLPVLTDSQIEAQLAARAERQRLLTELPNTAFNFIVEEHIFKRGTGGADITRELIDHLLTDHGTAQRGAAVDAADARCPRGSRRPHPVAGDPGERMVRLLRGTEAASSSPVRKRSVSSTCAMRNCVHRL